MHDENPSEPGTGESFYLRTWIVAAAGLILVLALVAFYFFQGGSAPPATDRASRSVQVSESGVETARQGLSRQTDLHACRGALQQINSELSEKQDLRPPAPSNEEKDWLRNHIGLGDEELSEVESSHYTRLDNHHLFRCFLMRDAVNALEVKGVRGKAGGQAVRQRPLEQAAQAFAWAVRQVRLRPDEGEPDPPSFVIRRGWGTALERALVFLALLEQLGEADASQPELLGFLLYAPDAAERMRLWACGVIEGDGKDVYLFDPYMGLPLPGPKGEGIATLAQAREQAEVLAQLDIGKKDRYPVTKDRARAAQAQLVCPLSSLSPRMRYLQDKLLGPAVRVRLASDAAKDLERIKAACSNGAAPPLPPARGGDNGGIHVSRDKCTLLRRFLAVEEGGADTTFREQLFLRDLVPWKGLPTVFQDERLFPSKGPLGIQVRFRFATPFVTPMMDAGQSRDLLVRGRYGSAVEKLVAERDAWRGILTQQGNNAALQEQFQKWLDEANHAYANLLKAKLVDERQLAEKDVKKLWEGRSSLPVQILLNSAAAAGRNPEAVYQLALCIQEQAEQLQARLDLQAQAGSALPKSDVEKAQSIWQNALANWKNFEEEYPQHPDAAAVRRQRGRAESMLGDHKAAIASWKTVAAWKDEPGAPSDLEKLACLLLAQREEKQYGGKEK